jgi:hypothetical protein
MVGSIERRKLCLAASALILLSGCSSKPYELAPVSGVVTLDGKPVPGTVVNFQPMAENGKTPGPGSTGRCDETGHYVLQTIRDEPGAAAGTHRVRIYSYSPESPVSQDSDSGPPKEQFPNRYNYGSQLTLVVAPEGTDSADFILTTEEQ